MTRRIFLKSKIMKKILLLVSIVAAMTFSVSAQEKNFIDVNYVEITGRAEMEVTPDEIYLNITINQADSRRTLQQREQEMMRALRDIGIDLEKNLTVGDMASDLQTFLLRRNTVQTTKTYQLKVNGATQLAAVFNVLSREGISDASITRVDVSNIAELRDEVRVMAIKAAQRNAATLSGAIGQSTGRAIFIQDYGYTSRPFSNAVFARSAMSAEAASLDVPDLEFQKVKIEYSVMVRFLLE